MHPPELKQGEIPPEPTDTTPTRGDTNPRYWKADGTKQQSKVKGNLNYQKSWVGGPYKRLRVGIKSDDMLNLTQRRSYSNMLERLQNNASVSKSKES